MIPRLMSQDATNGNLFLDLVLPLPCKGEESEPAKLDKDRINGGLRDFGLDIDAEEESESLESSTGTVVTVVGSSASQH
jgi:hypothetical protein